MAGFGKGSRSGAGRGLVESRRKPASASVKSGYTGSMNNHDALSHRPDGRSDLAAVAAAKPSAL